VKLLVVLEDRLFATPDNRAWSTAGLGPAAWDQYLEVFDEVRLAARTTMVTSAPPDVRLVSSTRAILEPIPTFHSPVELASRYQQVRRSLQRAASECDAVVLKAPGILANIILPSLVKNKQPYGVHVVGDPAEVFRKGVVDFPSPLLPLLRRRFVKQVQRQCHNATVVLYVDEEILSVRYPPGPTTTSAHASNVDLGDEAISLAVPDVRIDPPFRLVTVASLEQPYKGVDVLIRACARLVSDRNVQVELTVVGDGRTRPRLERLAHSLGLSDHVQFLGYLPGAAAVRAVVRESDLFVLASRTEGLPRALVEAMAQGIPSIATSVGGIPELLVSEDRVPSGDMKALADLIWAVVSNPTRRKAMADRGLNRAQDFRATSLRPRQQAAYQVLAATASQTTRPKGG
jgi:phosphatidyl-myo-inositol dimannoside synthase